MPRPTRIALAAFVAATLAAPAHATERLWTGGSVDERWSTVELGGRSNWSPGAGPGRPALQNGDRLAFHQGVRWHSRNDYEGLSVAGIDFRPGAWAHTLQGHALTLTGDLRNRSGAMQDLEGLPLFAGGDQTWDGGSAGLSIGDWKVARGTLRLAGTLKFTREDEFPVTIGDGGVGALIVDGGRMMRSRGLELGHDDGGGLLSLHGVGTQWLASGGLRIGVGGGMGRVEVLDGALLATRGANMGNHQGTVSLVDGARSEWDARGGPFVVGRQAVLRVAGGGTLRSTGLALEGVLELQGHDSSWRDGGPAVVAGGRLAMASGARAELVQLSLQPAPPVVGLPTGHPSPNPAAGTVQVDGGAQLQAQQLELLPHTRLGVDGGVVRAGRLQAQAGATVQLLAGRLEAQQLDWQAGALLDWRGGTLATTRLRLDAPGTLGAVLAVPAGGALELAERLDIGPAGVLVLHAGTRLAAATLQLDGGTLLRQHDAGWTLGRVGGSGWLLGGARLDGVVAPGAETDGATGELRFGGGDLLLGDGSLLQLDLGGGGAHDRLSGIGRLTAGGRVQLRFDALAAASPVALQFDLLDFVQWQGGFDPSRIEVQGLDAARVDLGRFALDGTVGVSPVPEPGAGLMLLGGLAFVAWSRRRLALRAD